MNRYYPIILAIGISRMEVDWANSVVSIGEYMLTTGMKHLFQGGFLYDSRVTHISLLTAITVE